MTRKTKRKIEKANKLSVADTKTFNNSSQSIITKHPHPTQEKTQI